MKKDDKIYCKDCWELKGIKKEATVFDLSKKGQEGLCDYCFFYKTDKKKTQ